MKIKDGIKIRGFIELICRDGKGNILWKVEKENLITSAGKAGIAGLVGNTGAISPFLYLALGTSATTPAIGDTTLGAEITDTGLARALGTAGRITTTVTNDTLTVVYTWTATGSKTIQEVGLFNASSGGILLGHALTGANSVVNNNQVQFTYKIAFA